MILQLAFAAAVALSSSNSQLLRSSAEPVDALERITGPAQQDAYYMTCFKTGERTSGMNKICFYDCLGSEAAITISSVELCPLTIER